VATKLSKALRKMAPGSIRKLIRTQRELQELKKTALRITKDRIIDDLIQLGLQRGDIVNLHSAMKSIGYVEGGATTVIEAITDVITSSGTLMVPAFSMKKTIYKTCLDKTYLFDIRSAGTHLGAIPSAFLELPGIHRSIHPTHSVAAIGKQAAYITEAHHLGGSIFGADSPWGRLMQLDGKLLTIGLRMGRNTISHVIEERDDFPVPTRMDRVYHLKCKDWIGNVIEVPVVPFDPNTNSTRMDNASRQDLRDYFWQEFNLAGILTVGKVGEAVAWSALANKYIEHLVRLMKEGITIYSAEDDLEKRPLRHPA
jgi:aminoglycoside N3'-acetyltransferase